MLFRSDEFGIDIAPNYSPQNNLTSCQSISENGHIAFMCLDEANGMLFLPDEITLRQYRELLNYYDDLSLMNLCVIETCSSMYDEEPYEAGTFDLNEFCQDKVLRK